MRFQGVFNKPRMRVLANCAAGASAARYHQDSRIQCDKQIIQIRADEAICNIRPVSANIWSVSVLSSSRSASAFADFICSEGGKSIRIQRIQILDGYSHKLFNNFITTTAIQLLLRPILFFHRCIRQALRGGWGWGWWLRLRWLCDKRAAIFVYDNLNFLASVRSISCKRVFLRLLRGIAFIWIAFIVFLFLCLFLD